MILGYLPFERTNYMVGKLLYHSLINLNNSERRILINKSKESGDKRFAELLMLLQAKPTSVESFTKCLAKIETNLSDSGDNDSEKNLKLRRFVNFAIREIEDMKMTNHLRDDPVIRSYVLAKCHQSNRSDELRAKYVAGLGKNTDSIKDYGLNQYFLDQSLDLAAKDQTIKGVSSWRELITKKMGSVHGHYQSVMANMYDLVSSSYLDDSSELKEFVTEYNQESKISAQIELSGVHVRSALFRLAQARFNFLDKQIFQFAIEEAKRLSTEAEGSESERLFIQRKIVFAEFLYGFHFGQNITHLSGLIERAIDLEKLLGKSDPKLLYYRALLNTMQEVETTNSMEALKAKVDDSTAYMVEFIEAANCICNNELSKAKRLFYNLSYCDNPYLASWARCADMVINFRQKDYGYVERLIQRLDRHLEKNVSRVFTLSSNIAFVNVISKRIDLPVPGWRRNYSKEELVSCPFHKWIIEVCL